LAIASFIRNRGVAAARGSFSVMNALKIRLAAEKLAELAIPRSDGGQASGTGARRQDDPRCAPHGPHRADLARAATRA
jgi:hypothetical protein